MHDTAMGRRRRQTALRHVGVGTVVFSGICQMAAGGAGFTWPAVRRRCAGDRYERRRLVGH